MGQKVSPIGMRVGVIRDWQSRWYADDKEFGTLLLEDVKIRELVEAYYVKLSNEAVDKRKADPQISRIEIERTKGRMTVIIRTAHPGVVIGQDGKSIEGLKEEVSSLKNQTPTFRSEGLNNLSAIQKSMSLEKDEGGRTEINIITQRAIASQAISKALDGVKDDAIKKSLESDALAFMMNPEAEMVGEDLARYMYGKGIKFVK